MLMEPQEIDSSYWKYLQGISYHHFKDYLRTLKAEEHFDDLYPSVLKKLRACEVIRLSAED